MQIERLEIPGILLLKPTKHGDQRGFFSETFRADIFAANGVEAAFVQDNHVRSAQKGVLRGLHFQVPPQRRASWCGARGVQSSMSASIFGSVRRRMAGMWRWSCRRRTGTSCGFHRAFAHGYITLEDDCEVIYKVTDYYAPELRSGHRMG